MRARLLFIVLAGVVVAGLAALNWGEVTRTSRLNFGLILTDAPLAGILLAILAVTLIVFLVSSAIQESRNLIAWNRHAKELQAQRDLADKAEASRFTDLRQHIDSTLRESRQRDALAGGEFEKSMLQSHRDLRAQLDAMNRTLLARLAELESRVDHRTTVVDQGVPVRDRTLGEVRPGEVHPTDVPPRSRMNV
jgi:hypothetical protein